MVAKIEQITPSPRLPDDVVSVVRHKAFFGLERTPCPAKLGNYHCNNRVYSIGHGRWLSPDQAANPAYNLFDYVGHRPINRADPSGLFMNGGGSGGGLRDGWAGNYDTHQGITARAAKTAGICGPATSYITDGAMAADGTVWKMIGSALGHKQSRTNANGVHVDNGDFEGAARWLRNASRLLKRYPQRFLLALGKT